MSAEPGGKVSWNELEAEAEALLRAAEGAGMTLRLIGSTAIRMHCETAARTMDRTNREPKDIDLISSSADRKGLRRMLEERGYEIDRDVLVAMEGTRFSFVRPDTGVELDVFFDRLEFCHKLNLSDRLDKAPATIPVEDLLLSKLQVHELTAIDVVDTAIVLATHEVAEAPEHGEQIDCVYISRLLARDWGFHRTATENLDRISGGRESKRIEAVLGRNALDRVIERGTALRRAIDETPKSRGWKLRAKVGERMQWWDDVSDRELTY